MSYVLDNREREIIRCALIAIVEGPFFPDWEFQTLFGVDRSEMRDALAKFPALSTLNSIPSFSVNNALFFLTTYPIKDEKPLSDYGVDLKEVAALLKKFHPSAKEFLDYLE
jgi:hypothetical protein